jgi:hypothetical protein
MICSVDCDLMEVKGLFLLEILNLEGVVLILERFYFNKLRFI